MIVVVIIGLLAAMAIPAFQKVRVASQDKAVLNNARQMVLEFKSGERESFPTAQEIKDRTNGQFFIRGMSNMFGIGGPLGAVTPTQQQNEVNEMTSLYFMFQDMYGQEADQHFMSLFGDEMAWLVKWRPLDQGRVLQLSSNCEQWCRLRRGGVFRALRQNSHSDPLDTRWRHGVHTWSPIADRVSGGMA
jgi:hypothetical protein